MSGPAHTDIDEERAEALPDAGADAGVLMASLRASGANRFDPVRWHYLETLAERAATYQGDVKRLLDAKLRHALETFNECFKQARRKSNEMIMQSTQQYPHASTDLQRLFDGGDFKALQRLLVRLKVGEYGVSLRALVNRIEQHAPATGHTSQHEIAAARTELKTLRESRNTWARLSVDKQVSRAIAQAPKNAGPINSHMLLLRSLAVMRDISPDYLSRFMSYADTLLSLDQGENEKMDKPKKLGKPKRPQVTRAAKK